MGLRAAMPETAPLPTLESLIEGKGITPEVQPSQEEASKPEEKTDRLDQLEREQKFRREQFALQKRIKELEGKLGDTSNKTSILDAKNPIKELAKSKNLSQDDMIKMALEAMDDDQSDEDKKEDLAKMSPEAIAKLVREQIEKENAEKESTKAQQEAQSKAINDFKENIKAKSKEMAETNPLVDALGGTDHVFNMINTKFNKDVEEYGEEYAQENIMSVEEAIKSTNEVLAKNIKDALQSKYLRDFILKAIKDDGLKDEGSEQSEELEQLKDEAVTLTNKGHRAATEASGKPNFGSDSDELDYLINKLI